MTLGEPFLRPQRHTHPSEKHGCAVGEQQERGSASTPPCGFTGLSAGPSLTFVASWLVAPSDPNWQCNCCCMRTGQPVPGLFAIAVEQCRQDVGFGTAFVAC